MTYDDEQVERQQPAEDRPCRHCGHTESCHEGTCYWRDGEDFCLCLGYEPVDAESILADEHTEEI
jgi:hypothetical protein